MPCRCRCRTPVPLAGRGRAHTIRRDRRSRSDGACPRPGGAGPRLRASVRRPGACHGAPSSRRCQRSAALRVAGTWAMSPQRWHTPALGALAPRACRPCQGERMPPYSYRPGPEGPGGSMAGIRRPGRGGLCGAVRRGAGCRSACGLPNRPGLRVPATPSGTSRARGGSERVSGQAAEGERRHEGQARGQDDEEDVGGAGAHGVSLSAGRPDDLGPVRAGRGAGGLWRVRRLMCIRCLIRGNAGRWLANPLSLRAEGR